MNCTVFKPRKAFSPNIAISLDTKWNSESATHLLRICSVGLTTCSWRVIMKQKVSRSLNIYTKPAIMITDVSDKISTHLL